MDTSMRLSIEAERQAAELERRAAAAETNTAISSDDPSALVKLRAKIGAMEAQRALLKAINKAISSARRRKREPGESWEAEAVASIVAIDATIHPASAAALCTKDSFGNIGVAPYVLTNLGANIRRLTARVATMEAANMREGRTVTIGAIVVTECDNRIRLVFDGKPPADVRTTMKRHGFRWAPSAGAWQAFASESAWRTAVRLATESTAIDRG